MALISNTVYHGTTKKNAENILRTKRFYDSTKPTEWLGFGAYFFQYKKHAEVWTKHSRYRGLETQVLRVELKYQKDQLLDLDDPVDFDSLKTIVERCVSRFNKEDGSVTTEEEQLEALHRRWCFACNLIRTLDKKIGIIAYTFPMTAYYEFEKEYFTQNQRQFCVSKHEIIHNIRTEVD